MAKNHSTQKIPLRQDNEFLRSASTELICNTIRLRAIQAHERLEKIIAIASAGESWAGEKMQDGSKRDYVSHRIFQVITDVGEDDLTPDIEDALRVLEARISEKTAKVKGEHHG